MIKFLVSYPGGLTHEVEFPGSVAVLGRDPGSDIVLNDSRCSRRHAIVEEDSQGVVVRDSASANGVYVNGRRVEEARLADGDVVRLGEVQLKLVAPIGETVVIAPGDFDLGTDCGPPPLHDVPRPQALLDTPSVDEQRAGRDTAAAPRTGPKRFPAASPQRPGGGSLPADTRPVEPWRGRSGRAGRPATVNLLVALWTLFVPASAAACLLAAHRLGGGPAAWTAGGVASVVLAALGVTMALGLRALAPWARHLQLATAACGLMLCPFTLASATLLLYLARPEVKAAFEGSPTQGIADDAAEATFALSVLGMLVLGLALTAVAAFVI